ncbi:MAG: SprT-like domain-containing protein [Phycisphaerae bacterium]|nr:SprT-like domain-containing protein [Phycisphaerae bacterium]
MDATKCMDVSQGLWTPQSPLPTRKLLSRLAARFLSAWRAGDLIPRVKIVYNPRLSTTLGRACLENLRVELNPRLLGEHPEELLPTLGHELAHLVVYARHGSAARPHGAEFRRLLRKLQLPDAARHRLPVEHLRRKRARYLYLHRCRQCGQSFLARSVRRNYYCLACGPEMEWDIFRAPNSPAGRVLLTRLRHSAGKHS